MTNTISSRETCLLSVAEVAWLLGVDNSLVCRSIRVGVLPVVRRRRRVLVPASALAQLADASGACADTQAGLAGRGDA
jgi:excisionase family DNA binding protein